jgi:tetraacyldisaccharide 4'-kinase
MLVCKRMHKIPSALAPLVCIPGLVFEALVRVRNRLYESSLLTQYRLPAPVISVGNITMGGTGKTPLVIYLARMVLNFGFTPVILTRGYGRQAPNERYILAPGEFVANPALTLGDEPALIRRHVPDAWMGISQNRLKTGQEIAKQAKRPVFILDDGFQHRRLFRDLDIVIIDRSQPLKSNRMFPRGSLREPLSELHRCHVVMINGAIDKAGSDPIAAEIHDLHEKSQILYCAQSIRTLIPFPSWKEGPSIPDTYTRVHSAYLVAAVGNPERFSRDIRQLGIEVRGTGFFADHHWLKPKDWQVCIEAARSQSVDTIIITEKDAIKISQPPDFPIRVAIQATEVFDSSALEQALKNSIEGHA